MSDETNELSDFVDLLMNQPLYSMIRRPNPKPSSPSNFSNSPGLPIPPEYYKSIRKLPSIEIHCPSDQCRGTRIFDTSSKAPKLEDEYSEEVIRYTCRNCGKSHKTYWLSFSQLDEDLYIKKMGEYPPFGPHIPSKLLTILRESRDLFIKGKRCESQGLGIGAFVYYRRVIENQKNKIIDKLIEVSTISDASDDFIESLKKAKKQKLFSKSIKQIKPMFPEILKIDGHNPLTLLNNALSKGVHEMSDSECLSHAQHIRIVLSRFAESLDFALKEKKELGEAVSKLLNIDSPESNTKKKQNSKTKK